MRRQELGSRTLHGSTPHTAGPQVSLLAVHSRAILPHTAGPGVTAAVSEPRPARFDRSPSLPSG